VKLDKICEALSQVDELCAGCLVDSDGMKCAIGQLMHVGGHKIETIGTNLYQDEQAATLRDIYGISHQDRVKIVRWNNTFSFSESPTARHKRILKIFEEMLIECLISQSSSPVEEGLSRLEDVLIAR